MLLLVAGGTTETAKLSAKTGASASAILCWKKRYNSGGLQYLLSDRRGGDYCSGWSAAHKQLIAQKIHDPENGFTTYGQAQQWMADELGVVKNYQAVNKYLKRNFGTKLKVGRKSHLKKDAQAVETFKKTLPKT